MRSRRGRRDRTNALAPQVLAASSGYDMAMAGHDTAMTMFMAADIVMAIAWQGHGHSHENGHSHDMAMTIAKNIGDPLLRHPIIRNPPIRTLTLKGNYCQIP